MAVIRQISQYARGRVIRRLSRSIPWIGGVIAIAGVGAVKNAVEAVRGRDFIRDKRVPAERLKAGANHTIRPISRGYSGR